MKLIQTIFSVFLSLMLIAGSVTAQEQRISLNACYEWARVNYPKINDTELQRQVGELRLQNSQVSWLPQINLHGQATYQSDVTKVEAGIPGVELSTPPKDQFKLYLDLKQNIYDGGVAKSLKALEESNTSVNMDQVEVELYSVNDMVNSFYYNILLMDESKRVLDLKRNTLNERLKVLESGFENGVVQARDVETLKAELILTGQQDREIEAHREGLLASLELLTGKEMSEAVVLERPSELVIHDELKRPEYELFSSMEEQLQKNASLIQKHRNPTIFGFGQAGYGQPGLNMMDDSFEPYYLVGVGISWKVLDWKKTQRERQVLSLQTEMVQSQRNTFTQQVNIARLKEEANFRKLKSLVESDKELVALRESIAGRAASQLENGVITSSDYISDLNAMTQAQINLEAHKIQLLQSVTSLNTLTGNIPIQ